MIHMALGGGVFAVFDHIETVVPIRMVFLSVYNQRSEAYSLRVAEN